MKQKLLNLKSWLLMMCLLVGVGNAWAQVSTAVATDGKSYILAAYSNGKYYALPQITSATTYSGTEVTVGADGKVASKAGLPIWTLTKNSSNATQFYVTYTNGTNTYYLYKNGTGNTNYNIKGSSTGDKNYWTFTKSSDGKYYNIVAVDRGNTNTYLDFYGSGTNIKWQVRGTSPSMESNNNTSIILLEVGASSEQFSYTIDKIGEGQILFKNAKGDEVKPGDKIDDGTVISPTFTPADGYEFTSWEYYTSMGAWQKITASTFTISKDVKFRVTFTATAPKAKYPVTIETAENGTLTIKDGETIVNNGDEVEEGKTLTIVVEPTDGYRLKNWGYKDGDAAWVGNNTSTFTHVMPSAACSFKATFEEIPTYTVAFSVNGAIKQTNTYEEGATVTAPIVDDINGKKFVGWVKTSTVNAGNTPTYETISKATENVTYYAVFATVDGDAAEIWSKVTNSASLVAGDVITFVSSTAVDYNKPGTKDKVNGFVAISSQNSSNWKGVGVTIENDVLTTTDNVKQFTLTATDSDEYPWAFCYDNNYLYASSNSSNQLKSTSDLNTVGAKFSLVISEGKATLTANREGRNTLQVNGSYNSGSTTQNPIFSCYASTANNTNPAIYKKSGGVTYSNFTTTPVPTYTLSEFIAKRDDLMENDVFNVTIEDDITIVAIETLSDGGYIVKISQDGMLRIPISAPAPTPAKEWVVGGSLSGTLNNVTWNRSEIVGEDASVWEGLTYKPIQTYTLSELFGTPSKEHVNVVVDDVIESCVKDAGAYTVTLNSGVSLMIRTDNLGWVADGTVKGTLNDVQWRGDNNTIYGKTIDFWKEPALIYTAPVTKGTIAMKATDGEKYYATFSCDKDVIIKAFEGDDINHPLIEGVCFVWVDDEGKLAIQTLANPNSGSEFSSAPVTDAVGFVAGFYVPKNTGVLVISGNNVGVEYYFVNEAVENYDDYLVFDAESAVKNMLRPSTVPMETDGTYQFYKLSYYQSNLGFYWGAEDGAPYKSTLTNGAYLAVPESTVAGAPQGFRLVNDESTGIDNINNSVAKDNVMYNLSGQRVNANAKGIVIVNGKKLFNK